MIRISAASRRELSKTFSKRAVKGKLKWMVLPYPINAQVQEAAMSLVEYEDFVCNSCLIDKEDPISEWKKIHDQKEKICEFLNKTSKIRIIGEDTDLTFNVAGRKWINSDGKRNMPSDEVFTASVENSANGTIRFTFPGIFPAEKLKT